MAKKGLRFYLLILLMLFLHGSLAENTASEYGLIPLDESNIHAYFTFTLSASTSPIDYKSDTFSAEYLTAIETKAGCVPQCVSFVIRAGDTEISVEMPESGTLTIPTSVFLEAKNYSGVSSYMLAITQAAGKAATWNAQAIEISQVQGALLMPWPEAEAINSQRYQMAISLQNQNDVDGALQILDQLATVDYQNSEALAAQLRNERIQKFERAVAAMNAGDYLTAKALFEALGDYENAPALAQEAHYGHGKALMEQGEYDAAAETFAQLSGYGKSDTYYKMAYYMKAMALMERSEYQDAIAVFQLVSDYEDAQERMIEAWYKQGEKELRAGNGEAAIRAFTQTGSYEGAKEGIIKAQILLAEQAMGRGEWDAASQAFVEAGADDRAFEPYIAWGDMLLAAGKHEEAIVAYQKALNWPAAKAEEKIYETQYQKGASLERAGQWEEAITAYQALIGHERAAEGIRRCRYALASALEAHGDLNGALDAFLALDDFSDAPQRVMALHYALGDQAVAQGQYLAARGEYIAAGAYQDAAQKAQAMIRLHTDALAKAGQYAEAYLLYQFLMDDEINALIAANDGLQQAAKDWKKAIRKGEIISFGRYETDGNPSNGPEPLSWLVLTVNDSSEALLLCVSLTEKQPFMRNTAYVTWKHSDLRAYLNGSFLSAAFSPAQQEAMEVTKVKAIKEDHTEVTPGNHTQDRLFCLNLTEYNKYILKEKKIQAAVDAMNLPSWYLRSPGKSMGQMLAVQEGGTTVSKNASLKLNICPAVWLDLKNDLFQ